MRHAVLVNSSGVGCMFISINN